MKGQEDEMPSVPEELNVFRRPHGHMMKLVNDIEREVCVIRLCPQTHTLRARFSASARYVCRFSPNGARQEWESSVFEACY